MNLSDNFSWWWHEVYSYFPLIPPKDMIFVPASAHIALNAPLVQIQTENTVNNHNRKLAEHTDLIGLIVLWHYYADSNKSDRN